MRLDLICVKDSFREIMQYVLVTKEHLVATDGHVLAVVKTENVFNKLFVDTLDDQRYLIHKDDWKLIKPGNIFIREENKIKIVNKRSQRDSFIPMKEEKEIGTYPKWETVIPRLTERMKVVELSHIGINAEFCTNVSKAIGARKCKFTFYGDDRAIELDPLDKDDIDNRYHKNIPYDGNYGLIMPVMLDN